MNTNITSIVLVALLVLVTLTNPDLIGTLTKDIGTDKYIEWVYSCWGTVLSIHGTFSALAIAFMSLFSQFDSARNPQADKLIKLIILKKSKFKEFSVISITGVFCGVVFYVCNGGLLSFSLYFISFISFIAFYINAYLELYKLISSEISISDYIVRALNELNNNIKNSETAIKRCINSIPSPNVNISEQEQLKVKSTNLTIAFNEKVIKFNGFDSRTIELLNQPLSIRAQSYKNPPSLTLDIQHSIDNFDTVHLKDAILSSFSVRNCIVFKKTMDIFPHAFIDEAIHAYISKDDTLGNEIISAILNANDDIMSTVNYLFINSNRGGLSYDESHTLKLYNSAYTISLKNRQKNNLRKIFTFIVDYLYDLYGTETKSTIAPFIVNINDNEYSILHKQFHNSAINALIEKKYKKLNLFHSSFKKLSSWYFYNQRDDEKTKWLLSLSVDILASLLIRLEHIKANEFSAPNINENEVNDIITAILEWTEPTIYSDLKYQERHYANLFNTLNEEYNAIAYSGIKDIGSDKVFYNDSDNYKIYAIALILSTSLSNGFLTSYAESIISESNLTTNKLDTMRKFLESDLFTTTLKPSYSNHKTKTYDNDAIEIINCINTTLKLYHEKILQESLPIPQLLEKYKSGLLNGVFSAFSSAGMNINENIIDDAVTTSIEIKVNKLELINPINGIYYCLNYHLYTILLSKHIFRALFQTNWLTRAIDINSTCRLHQEQRNTITISLNSESNKSNHWLDECMTDEQVKTGVYEIAPNDLIFSCNPNDVSLQVIGNERCNDEYFVLLKLTIKSNLSLSDNAVIIESK